MARLTPQEFQEKHARRTKGALDDMRKGVERVTESPTAKAAQKSDKMLANLQESVTSGRWQARLKAVSTEEWKSKMLEKGVGRVGSGLDAAAPKTVAFAEQLLPAVDAARSKVKAMPDLTFEDNMARATTYMREMHKFKKK